MTYQPAERRPIASRDLRVFQWLAHVLVRLNVSPNAISVSSMFFGVAAGIAFGATTAYPDWQHPLWLAAAALVQLRLLANLLDGMVAVEGGKASPVGELYNEVPDRVSDVVILVGAGFSLGGDIVLGFTAAVVALFTAYIRALGKSVGAPQDFGGPMAKPQRMFVVTVLALFHGITPAEWHLHLNMPPDWGFVALGLLVIIFFGILTALLRLFRVAEFLRKT